MFRELGLFSADGRVYRAYDQLQVPGGTILRFNFDAAERSDPMNSGRFTVDNAARSPSIRSRMSANRDLLTSRIRPSD